MDYQENIENSKMIKRFQQLFIKRDYEAIEAEIKKYIETFSEKESVVNTMEELDIFKNELKLEKNSSHTFYSKYKTSLIEKESLVINIKRLLTQGEVIAATLIYFLEKDPKMAAIFLPILFATETVGHFKAKEIRTTIDTITSYNIYLDNLSKQEKETQPEQIILAQVIKTIIEEKQAKSAKTLKPSK